MRIYALKSFKHTSVEICLVSVMLKPVLICTLFVNRMLNCRTYRRTFCVFCYVCTDIVRRSEPPQDRRLKHVHFYYFRALSLCSRKLSIWTLCDTVWTGGTHDDSRLIPAFEWGYIICNIWLQLISFEIKGLINTLSSPLRWIFKKEEEKTHYKQLFHPNHMQHECRDSTPEYRIALWSKRSIIILILKSKDASWPENVENEQIFTSASKEEEKDKKGYFYKSKILP